MLNKRFFSGILLTGYILGVGSVSLLLRPTPIAAQTQGSDELYYTYFDQKIPLTLRSDAIAVEFKPVQRTRSRSNQPLYLQLQQDLHKGGGTRSSTRNATLKVEVSPLGENYALVNLPSGTRSSPTALQQRIQQQPYVQKTLPVLSRTEAHSSPRNRPQVVVLPNEIVVSFKAGVSETEKQSILAANDLEIIRPIRFSQNRYLVRTKTTSGTAVLGVANRLNSQPKVQSATPNFIQSLTNQGQSEISSKAATLELPATTWKPKNPLMSLFQADASPIRTALLPIQWHLNSTPLATCLKQRKDDSEGLMESLNYLNNCFSDRTLQAAKTSLPRTDMRVTEAWKNSNQGEGVVVAVIDSLIQWNHPDLAGNLYKIGNVSDSLPGEVSGWDFVENDPDTRISKDELNILKVKFRDGFNLSDEEIRQKYPNPLLFCLGALEPSALP